MIRRPFDPAGQFVAGKDILIDGTSFPAGTLVPVESLGLAPRKVRILWNAHHLEMRPPNPPSERKTPRSGIFS